MYSYKTKGVCSHKIEIKLDDNNKIEDVKIIGGCQGNLSGLATMCKGQDAQEVIQKLKGIKCGSKSTSCPDQLSIALEQALETRKKASSQN